MPPVSTLAPHDIARRVVALADAFVAAYLQRYPETSTFYGVPGARHDRLTDNGCAALRAWEQREDAWLAEARGLDADAIAGSDEWIILGTLREQLESSVMQRVCRLELWGVNQTTGWQSQLPWLAEIQPVGNDALRAQALQRWGALPEFIDVEIANLREGLRLGWSAPRVAVPLVIEQVDGMRSTDPQLSPFFAPARADGTASFAEELSRLVRDAIDPALGRYRDFLEREYLPRARETIAVSALPGGEACYRAAVRTYSTLDLDPRAIHRLGLEQIALVEAEMRAIAERSFGTTDVAAVLRRLTSDAAYTFRSRDEVIACSRAALERARAVMPRWFGLLPRADVVIQPYPDYLEKSAPGGQYNAPAEDGSRPGVYQINTYQPEHRSRSGPESVAFHETIPGHHLQGAIALERASSHPIAKYFGNSGYVEGWAVYAERLADEMGLFSSDVDRMGMLSELALRAARLVVDPGIHVLGWSREQALAYMRAHTTIPPAEAESEVDRYIVWPGQATSYLLGALEMRRLREDAERAQGPTFDIRAFHDQVLKDGAVPLAVLRAKVERWRSGSYEREGHADLRGS